MLASLSLLATNSHSQQSVSSQQATFAPHASREMLLRDARQIKIRMIWEEAREKMERAAELKKHHGPASSPKSKKPSPGKRLRRSPKPELPSDVVARANARPLPEAPPRLGVSAVPTNVRCNNTAGDAGGSGQSEEAVAALGPDILVAWNDGQGFEGVYSTLQGVGYSTDGGASFTDVGFPPSPVPGFIWESDPSVTVNEKTGDFYFCALIADSATRGNVTNGIATIRATFSGSNLLWDIPHVVETVSSSTDFYDKQWLVADSTSGNLYLTYTHFTSSDSIIFRRSLNKGLTWGPKLTLSSVSGAGAVQGSRPAVGPSGEVYATWLEGGLAAADFFRIRKSTDAGVSFGTQGSVADSFYSNFGSGAPGFNRP